MFNMLMQRQEQDKKARELFRRPPSEPLRGLLVGVPLYEGEAALRRSQAEYYATHGGPCEQYFFAVCQTWSEFKDAVEGRAPIDELKVLSHGDQEGCVVFPFSDHSTERQDHKVSHRDLFDSVSVRGNLAGFATQQWIHCYNHVPERTIDEGIMDYHRRRLHQTTTSVVSPVTYNVPREFVDGQHGFVHSGLNPEVLDLPYIRQHFPQWIKYSQQLTFLRGLPQEVQARLSEAIARLNASRKEMLEKAIEHHLK